MNDWNAHSCIGDHNLNELNCRAPRALDLAGRGLIDTCARQPRRWRNSPGSSKIGAIMSRSPLDEILELPTAQRVEIAQEIWESVFEHPDDVFLTSAQKEELERRWRAFEENPDEGEPWEDVKQSLLSE